MTKTYKITRVIERSVMDSAAAMPTTDLPTRADQLAAVINLRQPSGASASVKRTTKRRRLAVDQRDPDVVISTPHGTDIPVCWSRELGGWVAFTYHGLHGMKTARDLDSIVQIA